MNMKTCTTCLQSFPESEFPKKRKDSEARRSQCKACKNKANKKWRTENHDRHLQNCANQRANNQEKRKKWCKDWEENNRDHRKDYKREYRLKNKDSINRKQRELWETRGKFYQARYHEKHPEKYKNICKGIWEKKKATLQGRLENSITCGIRKSILKGSKKRCKWETLVGYTIEALMNGLKSTMPDGYTWADYMEGKLHIDHIIPKSVFNYETPFDIDFKRCWSLDNLQLLPAKENLKKSDKLHEEFQPSLALRLSA